MTSGKDSVGNSIDKTITSDHNPVFRDLRACLTSKGIKQQGQFLVAGEKAVKDTLERFPERVRNLVVCAERHMKDGTLTSLAAELLASARSKTKKNEPRFTALALSKPLFDELDVSGSHAPLLVATTPPVPEVDLTQAPKGLEILCGLSDPSNVGALLRSAAAFGASRVILLQESASPFHPKAVRAASASTLITPLARGPSIKNVSIVIERESEVSGRVVALDMSGKDLGSYTWPRDVRVLMGEEGQGVPSSKVFDFVTIPIAKDIESLNATIASSIALYSYRQQHPLK